jgi:hypothetical protein
VKTFLYTAQEAFKAIKSNLNPVSIVAATAILAGVVTGGVLVANKYGGVGGVLACIHTAITSDDEDKNNKNNDPEVSTEDISQTDETHPEEVIEEDVATEAEPIVFGGSTTTCPLPKYPTPDCTGVLSGVKLAESGSVTLAAGQVLDGKKVNGDVTVSGNGAVIKNSDISGRIRNLKGASFTVQDTTVGPASGCSSVEAVGYENYTAQRVLLRNVVDGFRVSGDNILIEDSFVVLCSHDGDHSDGIQGYYGGKNVVIRHNTIDQRPAESVTSPIFFADGSESAIIQNNLLMGGGYSLRIHDSFSPDHGPWAVKGNRIVSGTYSYGPVTTAETDCSAVTWTDNRLATIDSKYNIVSLGAAVNCN